MSLSYCPTFAGLFGVIFWSLYTLNVEGVLVNRGEFKSVVSLRRGPLSKHFCSGTLLNNYVILTTAHCVDGYRGLSERQLKKHLLQARFGTLKLGSSLTTRVIAIRKVIPHEGYRRQQIPIHDIALLVLQDSIQESAAEFVRFVRLPRLYEVFEPPFVAVAAGWGKTDAVDSAPPLLMKREQNIIHSDECGTQAREFTGDNSLASPAYICGVRNNATSGVCCEDSGSGLFVRRLGSNRTIQIGITSFGEMEADYSGPEISTALSNYIMWVMGHIYQIEVDFHIRIEPMPEM